MIKGVNLRTIEVRETGNKFFERAILFIAPSAGEANDNKLKSEAEKFLSEIERPPKSKTSNPQAKQKKRRMRIIKNTIIAVFWSLAGAGTVLLIQMLS